MTTFASTSVSSDRYIERRRFIAMCSVIAPDRMLGFFEEHDELYWNVTGL